MRSTAVSLAVIAVLAFMGCAPSDPPAEQTAADSLAVEVVAEEPDVVALEVATERVPESEELVGGWLLEDLGGRGVMDIAQTTLEFDGEGRASGSGGCNRYTGSYTFADGQLVFGPLAGTKMMCPEAVMDQEDRFHRALGTVERVVVSDPFLLIYFAGSEQPLRFTRMEPDAID